VKGCCEHGKEVSTLPKRRRISLVTKQMLLGLCVMKLVKLMKGEEGGKLKNRRKEVREDLLCS
jgi:hypothetical protein